MHVHVLNYIDVIAKYHPGVFVSCKGNPNDYDQIFWEAGEPLPTKAVLDTDIIRAVQDDVTEQIKAFRDRRKSCGVMAIVGGKEIWFHSDPDSRIQFLGLKSKARDLIAAGGTMETIIKKMGTNVIWKPLSQDEWVPMTCQLAFDLEEAVGDLDALLFAACEQHKWAMIASPNPAEYDYTTEYWPAQFLP